MLSTLIPTIINDCWDCPFARRERHIRKGRAPELRLYCEHLRVNEPTIEGRRLSPVQSIQGGIALPIPEWCPLPRQDIDKAPGDGG